MGETSKEVITIPNIQILNCEVGWIVKEARVGGEEEADLWRLKHQEIWDKREASKETVKMEMHDRKQRGRRWVCRETSVPDSPWTGSA